MPAEAQSGANPLRKEERQNSVSFDALLYKLCVSPRLIFSRQVSRASLVRGGEGGYNGSRNGGTHDGISALSGKYHPSAAGAGAHTEGARRPHRRDEGVRLEVGARAFP